MMEPNYFIGKRVSSGAFKPQLLIYHQLIAVSLEFQLFFQQFILGSTEQRKDFFLQTCIAKSYVLFMKASSTLE